MGCFGAPMNATNKQRYTQNSSFNQQADRTAKINAASADTFGFDCVCLIKGILWGWNGNTNAVYGGATYASNGVSDMMSHIFERYFSDTPHCEITDGLCESVLKTIIRNAPKLLADPQNYDAWAEIGFAGTIAHNNLLGLGRVQDWACHGMEHEISAVYDVAHGAGLAVVTPAWMKFILPEKPYCLLLMIF